MNESTQLHDNIRKLRDNLENIEEKLVTKQNTYPNLYKAWHTTLNFKINKLNDLIDSAHYFCKDVDNTLKSDVKPETLALLYILNNNYLKK